MAKKKASKKRHRRSDQELISDLRGRIKDLKNRQESKRLKESATVKATITAVKWIDRALEHAAEENDTGLRHVLADSRRPLETYLTGRGLKLPKAKLPRGRRPKDTE
jgi:hypothetical protein